MAEIAKKIKVICSRLELGRIRLKHLNEIRDEQHLQAKIEKQKAIIREAQEEILTLQQQFNEAPQKIEDIERNMRYDRRELKKLERHKEIEQLLATAKKLKELEDESGESTEK